MWSKLAMILRTVLSGEVSFSNLTSFVIYNQEIAWNADFCLRRKGFCCHVSIHVSMLHLEKRQIKSTVFEWKDSSLQDTKALRKSNTIIYCRVCWAARGWTQNKVPLEAITWRPPAVKLQSSGKQIRAGFPTARPAMESSTLLFSVFRNCLSSLSSASSHLKLWVSRVHKYRKSFFCMPSTKGHYINKHWGSKASVKRGLGFFLSQISSWEQELYCQTTASKFTVSFSPSSTTRTVDTEPRVSIFECRETEASMWSGLHLTATFLAMFILVVESKWKNISNSW